MSVTTNEQRVKDAVPEYALGYFGTVYQWDLGNQGMKPHHYEDWTFNEHFRVVHSINSVTIDLDESKPDEGYYFVEVDAQPEMPDIQLFEAQINGNGSINVNWHGN